MRTQKRISVGLTALTAYLTVSSPSAGANPEIESSPLKTMPGIRCMKSNYFCSGAEIVTTEDLLEQEETLFRLQSELLLNPQDSEGKWIRMVGLMETAADRRRQVEIGYRRVHWQEPPEGAFDRHPGDLLHWLDLWRNAYPQSEMAWSWWARKMIAKGRIDQAVAELESALVADPTNPGARQVLIHTLVEAGQLERADELRFQRQGESLKVQPKSTSKHPQPVHNFLPQDTEQIYRSHIRSKDFAAAVDVLRRFDQEHPDHPTALLRWIDLSEHLPEEARDPSVEQRFQDIADGELSFESLAELCHRFPTKSLAGKTCWAAFDDRAVGAGLHLDIELQAVVDAGDRMDWWDDLRHQMRMRLIQDAVEQRDQALLETLLTRGPDYGYVKSWQKTLTDLKHIKDQPSDAALREKPNAKELRQGLCQRLAQTAETDLFHQRVVQAAAVCPGRVGNMVETLKQCELSTQVANLLVDVAAHLPQLDPWPLNAVEAEPQGKIAEIERRLEDPSIVLENDVRDALELTLADLLLKTGDLARLRSQKVRYLERVAGPESAREWLQKMAYRQPAFFRESLWAFAQKFPSHAKLALRAGFEHLWPNEGERDLEKARHLAEGVRENPSASVRQRAEARFLLGRIDVYEGRWEDATRHLESFFKALFEHDECPQGYTACDFGFMLHLIGSGDWPRLESYLQWRQKATADKPMTAKQEKAFEELSHHFLKPKCGLKTTLPYLERLAAQHPNDRQIQARLTFERDRECRIDFDLWRYDQPPQRGTARGRAKYLLWASDDLP